MSSIRTILKKEMEKSNGAARLVKVQKHMRPTAESLEKLDREISAQIESDHRSGFDTKK